MCCSVEGKEVNITGINTVVAVGQRYFYRSHGRQQQDGMLLTETVAVSPSTVTLRVTAWHVRLPHRCDNEFGAELLKNACCMLGL